MKDFTVTTTVTAKRIMDLLITALEGGSNYWCALDGLFLPNGTEISDFTEDALTNDYYPTYIQAVTHDDVHIMLYDVEDHETTWKLTREGLAKGLQLLSEEYPKHYRDMLAGHDDADTADAFLQLAALEEIVYG